MLYLIFCLTSLLTVLAAPSVHTIFLSSCKTEIDWRSVGFIYSHKRVGQPGPLTRLTACTHDAGAISMQNTDLVKTFVARSIAKNTHNKDTFDNYDKPGTILQWLSQNDITEEYILVMDEDVVMRAPILPSDLKAEKGVPVAALKPFLRGLAGPLAERLAPSLKPKRDFHGGEFGRRADQVGGFLMIHREDLKRVAPAWLEWTEKVRNDPDKGDTKEGKVIKDLAADLYGYALASAHAGLEHRVSPYTLSHLYDRYRPRVQPRAVHYSLVDQPFKEFKRKREFYEDDFRPFDCDRNFYLEASHMESLFLPLPQRLAEGGPPLSMSFPNTTDLEEGSGKLRELLALELLTTLNEAVCWWHRSHCKMSELARKRCELTRRHADEIRALVAALPGPLAGTIQGPDPCQDDLPLPDRCDAWAKKAECVRNPDFMHQECRRACLACRPDNANSNRGPRNKPYVEDIAPLLPADMPPLPTETQPAATVGLGRGKMFEVTKKGKLPAAAASAQSPNQKKKGRGGAVDADARLELVEIQMVGSSPGLDSLESPPRKYVSVTDFYVVVLLAIPGWAALGLVVAAVLDQNLRPWLKARLPGLHRSLKGSRSEIRDRDHRERRNSHSGASGAGGANRPLSLHGEVKMRSREPSGHVSPSPVKYAANNSNVNGSSTPRGPPASPDHHGWYTRERDQAAAVQQGANSTGTATGSGAIRVHQRRPSQSGATLGQGMGHPSPSMGSLVHAGGPQLVQTQSNGDMLVMRGGVTRADSFGWSSTRPFPNGYNL